VVIKPGQLVKLRPATGLLWVWTTDLLTGDRFSFCYGEIGLYLNWGGSKNNGAEQLAHVLIGDRKVSVDEKYIEPVNS
jgi:hypothetical protein